MSTFKKKVSVQELAKKTGGAGVLVRGTCTGSGSCPETKKK